MPELVHTKPRPVRDSNYCTGISKPGHSGHQINYKQSRLQDITCKLLWGDRKDSRLHSCSLAKIYIFLLACFYFEGNLHLTMDQNQHKWISKNILLWPNVKHLYWIQGLTIQVLVTLSQGSDRYIVGFRFRLSWAGFNLLLIVFYLFGRGHT